MVGLSIDPLAHARSMGVSPALPAIQHRLVRRLLVSPRNLGFVQYVQYNVFHHHLPLVMFLSMPLSMVLVLHEHVFVSAISCKCHGRYSQAREAPFESIPSREGACISPSLSDRSKLAVWHNHGQRCCTSPKSSFK